MRNNSCADSRSHVRSCDWQRQLRQTGEKIKSTSFIPQPHLFLTSWSGDCSWCQAETCEAAPGRWFTLIQNQVCNFPSNGSLWCCRVYTVTGVPLKKKTSFWNWWWWIVPTAAANTDHRKMRPVVTHNWAAIEAYGINCLQEDTKSFQKQHIRCLTSILMHRVPGWVRPIALCLAFPNSGLQHLRTHLYKKIFNNLWW